MFLPESERQALVILRKAKGHTIRSNYTAEAPDRFGDWPMHWHTLDGLMRDGLAMRVGRYYAPRDRPGS